MHFLDYATILVQGGKGGDGLISFRREKYIPYGGPDGGNGGDGGNVWICSNKNLYDLSKCVSRNSFIAQNGQNGKKNNASGKKGKDIVISVPLGTKIFYMRNTHEIVLGNTKYHDEKFIVARGGKHGFGNYHFKSSVCRVPRKCTTGEPGESKIINLNFTLSANVGLFGLPNTGRSLFMKTVSRAKPKIAHYPFTTKLPYLGVVKIDKNKKFICIDIPSIKIDHYATNANKFSKHLQKCKLILHFVHIDCSNIKDTIKNIEISIKIIKNFGNLRLKTFWLIFNKSDLICNKNLFMKQAKFISYSTGYQDNFFVISSHTKHNLNLLLQKIYDFILVKNNR
ncbi:DNA repair and cell partioning GTPase [Wigglesworthia glossinidia endosymbiont of Glossina morsitans morsitans (Yale colony)]|uniref:DNA repair and cell partioning GTPase n=1 Tax=Wigglesworthia glossinidia endosymbiont of Glossina morsitans morsitans (Yale colony) TaxID=1142511 RepID=H6Q5S6_WIGGL|nr:GTPase ObgE [Wigglesworthia glossinidia]AFA41122.1 DNA repair and cell partioning GTPase [Wigglesworthia glossinidia endosymbiont of Glossina morsitans morsitans (Yale colony)]